MASMDIEFGGTAHVRSICDKAVELRGNSVDPRATESHHEYDGLLYGLIQSGKTSILTLDTALAADTGFECIVILTSDIDLLYDQTLERVRKALSGLTVLGKLDFNEPDRFAENLKITPLVLVCTKNASKLTAILELLKKNRAGRMPALILDDEADQASLNTKTSRKNDEFSRINEAITELRELFTVNTYIQVTATPQALFLQRPDGAYRPSFTVLSEPGPGYIGGDEFFCEDSTLLKYVDQEEVDELRAGHQPSPSKRIPDGLRMAICTFFVAAASLRIQRPTDCFAFLCHVSLKQSDQSHVVDVLDAFKRYVYETLSQQGSGGYQQLHQLFEQAYDELLETNGSLPPFEAVLDRIAFWVRGASIKLVNAKSGEEIRLDSAFNLFVGGNKLGRGVTIKNLLVSYYGRNPQKPNADTVLQHARMYGYRRNELGVTRLFLPEHLAEHFRTIHLMESALRDLVRRKPRGKFEGILLSKKVSATRRNVLDPASLGLFIAGKSYNPVFPLRDGSGKANTEWLDKTLEPYRDGEVNHVSIDELITLIGRCPADANFGIRLWDIQNLTTALEKLKRVTGAGAYLVVRRGRDLNVQRRETQGILDSGEAELVPDDAATLFLYRQNAAPRKQLSEAWWPQLRFADGNYAICFSYDW